MRAVMDESSSRQWRAKWEGRECANELGSKEAVVVGVTAASTAVGSAAMTLHLLWIHPCSPYAWYITLYVERVLFCPADLLYILYNMNDIVKV